METSLKIDVDRSQWFKRRKWTTYVFYSQSLLLGIEYSLTFTYLYLYLKDVLHTEHVILFYSAISTIFLLSMVISSLVLGSIFDKYRNLRQQLILTNIMVFFGNMLYCIPLSPWFLFCGRLLAGIGGSARSIMAGELVRVYKGKEVVQRLLKTGMSFGFGFIAGPGLNFFFLTADFHFLGIHITYINGAVLVLVFATLVQLAATIFLVSDLSKEYDPKGESEKEERLSSSEEKDSASITMDDNGEDKEKKPLLDSTKIDDTIDQQDADVNLVEFLKELIKRKETFSILLFSLFFFFCYCLFDIWQPMAFVKFIGWGGLQINMVNFGFGICSIIFFTVLSLLAPNQKNLLYLAKFTFIETMLLVSIFLVWKYYHVSYVLNIVTSVCFCILFSMVILMEEVFFVNTLAQLVSTNKQSFAEGIRLAFSRFGALLSLLVSPMLFGYLEFVCPVIILILIVFLIWLHFNQESYINPKIIIH